MTTRRLIVTARNNTFPFVSDGNTHPVRSQDITRECSTAPDMPPDCVTSVGRRALTHLRSLKDEELALYARQLGDSASELELELATRVLNLLDDIEAANNSYNGDE